ncbi:MAG: PQQ-binding-like beta-propeller repeat protein [Ktedonobacterales bacterium]
MSSSLRSVAPLVVVETADAERHAPVICGLDGLDGHERWRFVMERDHVIPPNGLATNGDAVYAATTAGWVYALRVADGSLVWQHDVAHQPLSPRYTLDLRLMAAGGIMAVDYIRPDLPVSTGRCITALDGQDGSQRWVVRDLQAVFPGMLLPGRLRRPWQGGLNLLGADGTGVYVSAMIDRGPHRPDRQRTLLLDRQTGHRSWSTRQAAAVNFAGHWGSRTTVAPAGRSTFTLGKRLSALDTASGRVRWSQPVPSEDGIRIGPLVANETVLCAAYEALFQVHRADDGALLWQLGPQVERGYLGGFLGMVLLGDSVYVGHHAHNPGHFVVEAHDARTGALRWEWPHLETSGQQQLPARGDISWRLVGAAGILYVPGPTTLTAVRASDGQQLWQRPGGGLPALVALSA